MCSNTMENTFFLINFLKWTNFATGGGQKCIAIRHKYCPRVPMKMPPVPIPKWLFSIFHISRHQYEIGFCSQDLYLTNNIHDVFFPLTPALTLYPDKNVSSCSIRAKQNAVGHIRYVSCKHAFVNTACAKSLVSISFEQCLNSSFMLSKMPFRLVVT